MDAQHPSCGFLTPDTHSSVLDRPVVALKWRAWDEAVIRAICRECRVSDELAVRGASEIYSATSQHARHATPRGLDLTPQNNAAAPLTKNPAFEVVAHFLNPTGDLAQ